MVHETRGPVQFPVHTNEFTELFIVTYNNTWIIHE